MPKILELVQGEDHTILARLPQDLEASPIHIWTDEEAKAAQRRAILDFCRDLAERYIQENIPYANP